MTTVAAGVGPPPHSFRFHVRVTILGGSCDRFAEAITFEVPDYVSGQYRDFLIMDLSIGEYSFSVQSINNFGMSAFTTADNGVQISGTYMYMYITCYFTS